MSQFMKRTGGRYGFHSGSGKVKNMEIVNRLNVAGNEMPIMPMNGDVFYVDKNVTASGDGRSWKFAFKTATEGFAALQDFDTLIIGPGNYDEADVISLDDVKSVRIFGAGNGMQWGEGSTCLRNVVATTKDILDMADAHCVEIAGINFINIGAYDAINFDGLCYSCHIHDCGFIGDQGAGTGVYGINANSSSGPDLYVHDCRFMGWATTALMLGNQRNVVRNNYFVVPNSGKGIHFSGAATKSYALIADNYFLGGGTSDYGIYTATATAGNFLLAKNIFANFASSGEILDAGGAGSDENTVENLADSTGGAVEQVDPEA